MGPAALDGRRTAMTQRYGTRLTVEECFTLSVETFGEEHQGDLRTIAAGGELACYSWHRDGEQIASVTVRGRPGGGRRREDDAIDLLFAFRAGGASLRGGGDAEDGDAGDGVKVVEQVNVTYTEPHFGGRRPWFRCPDCGERRGTLHSPRRGPDPAFLCRECNDLTYKSAQKSGNTFWECLGKPQQRLAEAKETGNLREIYQARKDFENGMQAFRSSLSGIDQEAEETPRRSLPPTFDEWVDEQFSTPGDRHYGHYGRCEATARSTGERCRQPATGDHRKCYYHGGAPGTGVGEDQVDRQREQFEQRLEDMDGDEFTELVEELDLR